MAIQKIRIPESDILKLKKQCIYNIQIHFSQAGNLFEVSNKNKYSHIPLFSFLFLFLKATLEHNLIFTEFYFELSIGKYHCEVVTEVIKLIRNTFTRLPALQAFPALLGRNRGAA